MTFGHKPRAEWRQAFHRAAEEQDMTLELTTKFRGISTSPAARKHAGSAAETLKRCYGALNYAAREAATGRMTWKGLRRPDGLPAVSPKQARLALRARFRAEAAKGGKVGRRIATTGIVSLPNSWSEDAIKSAMDRLAAELAPTGSEASAIVIQHIDKENNAHLHFIAVDGIESREQAIERVKGNAQAQRVRRQNVQRFNERGAPKRWRRRIATILNDTATDYGEACVEWRSFEARGLRRKATLHDGPEKRARESRNQDLKSISDLFNNSDLGDDIADLLNASDRLMKGVRDGAKNHGGEQRQRE